MANNPTITTINDSFTEFKDNVNTISLDLGATGRLNTNEDSDVVSSINELELGLRGTSNNLVATDLSMFTANNVVSALIELDVDIHGAGGGTAASDLDTTANDVVSAINEIEGVFDASEFEISASGEQFDITSAAFNLTASGDVTVDGNSDIILDANGGNVYLKDDGADFGSLVNSAGNLIIKSGTSTMLTGSGTNATFNNDLTVENDLQVDGQTDLNGNINLGNANTDTISVVGRVDTSIVPSTDNARDLGASGLEFRDLYIDRTAYIDNLDADSAEIGNINIAGNSINSNAGIEVKSTAGDVTLDANGADVKLKDAGTQYGALTNTSGNLIVKSGTTTALTFSGANVTTAGTVQTGGNITMGGAKINRTGALTLDVSTDITLDAGGGDVFLKDDGTTYGSLTNTSGNLIIKSGTTTAATFDGANVTFSGTITGGTLNTTATDVVAAINEHETDIGNMTLTGLSATNISAGLRELRTELGAHGSLVTQTTTSAVAAINELHGEIGDAIGATHNTTTGNIGQSLNLLDSAVGNLDNLDDTDVPSAGHNNLVSAINEVAGRVTTLDGSNSEVDSRIGSLSNLNAAFTGTEDDSIVNAINALYNMIPDIYDESGTLLN